MIGACFDSNNLGIILTKYVPSLKFIHFKTNLPIWLMNTSMILS